MIKKTTNTCLVRKPSLPTIGLSRKIQYLPKPVRFQGLDTQTLDNIKFAVPMLTGAYLISISMQQGLSPFFIFVCTSVALFTSLTSDLWIKQRRFLLKSSAYSLWKYAEHIFGPKHELTKRALKDVQRFKKRKMSTTNLIGMEARLRYTWELLQKPYCS